MQTSSIDITLGYRRIFQDSFFEFFKYYWKTVSSEKLVVNWHIEYLCNVLQEIGQRVIDRKPKLYDLCINISPGESKSTICSQLFPVWLWAKDATIKIISGSYSKELSLQHSLKSRDCINSDEFREMYLDNVILKKDQDNKSNYATEKGGSRVSVSVGSTVTGFHGHVLIIDDPLNPKQASSDVLRNSANDWMDKTLSSRKVDEAIVPTILIMQRLHEEDCAAKFLDSYPDCLHISLPASNEGIVKPPELEERYIEGVMNPLRRNKEILDSKKKLLGSKEYAGQYLQSPSPMEGNLILKKWFSWYDINEVYVDQVANFYIDGAYTEKKQNDPSAILSFFEEGGNLYLIDCSTVRKAFPDLIRFIAKYIETNNYTNYSKIIVEPKASGISIVQSLKDNLGLNVWEDKQTPLRDSKTTRVNAVSPLIEAGKIYLPKNQDWTDDFINECSVFPNGKHDDQVDTLVGAIFNTIAKKKTNFTYTAFTA